MGKCIGFPLGGVMKSWGAGHEGGGENKAMWVKHNKVILESPN